MKVLLLQLEFPTWATARPWSYGASFAVADGLAANGITCVTVPIGPDASATSPASWLHHARRILAGQRFDQVWIWLVHAPLDPQILDWVSGLAPVRIGFIMESLRYEEEDYTLAPELRTRYADFHRQLQYLTHALLVDERDVAELTALGKKPALWCPGLVPRRFIAGPTRASRHDRAVFHGNPYGHRAHWIEHPLLRDRLTFAKAPTEYTANQQRFDEIQSVASERLLHHPLVTATDLERYVRALHNVRESEFRSWLAGLSDWPAIINLPGLTRCFGGRVYEAMASGRPVVSWRIPDRPRVNALFEDNREILLFPPDDPPALANQIDRILQDKSFAQAIGARGQRKLLAYHTAEQRAQQILEWIDSGKEPDYGIRPTSAEQPTGAGVTIHAPHVLQSGRPGPSGQAARHFGTSTNAEPAALMPTTEPRRSSSMEDSALEHQHDKYFVQKVQASNELAGIDRLDVFRRLCENKRVLHLGCVDYPIFDPQNNLHIQLETYCAVLDGFDVNADEFKKMRPYLKGRLFSKWEELCDEYDVVLVPEVMEHVPNVQEFLGHLSRIRTSRVVITVPDAFQCFRRHFDYNRETSTFVEVVHPDHNCWYTPYTLTNTIKKYTDWAIDGVWFVNGISVMAIANVKQRASEPASTIETRTMGQPKILLACDYYWPSTGGVETIAANLGVALGQCGYEVEIAARSLPDRVANVHRGMVIHSLDANTQSPEGFPAAVRQLQSLIESGRYAAVIVTADPLTWVMWSLEGAQVPKQTRILVQPLINEDGYLRWKDNRQFRDRVAAVLRRATNVVSLTHKGADARFLESEGISFDSIPNATTPEATTTDFRDAYGFEQGRPLVIHVANLWRVKNQLGLIQSFRNTRIDAQIALIGNPSGDKEYESAVRAEVPQDPRFTLLTGLHGEKIAAAMQAADLVLLPSLGDVFPVTLLEAMSHGKPWLATPQCGAANELAGGIIAPLEHFPAIVERLLANPDLLRRFGQLGQRHWETSFQWPRVAHVWSELITKGTQPSAWEAPREIWEETLRLRRQVMRNETVSLSSSGAPDVAQQVDLSGFAERRTSNQDRRQASHTGGATQERQANSPGQATTAALSRHAAEGVTPQLPLVSVIVPTHDRPAMLLEALKSILAQTYNAFEILVIDDGSTSVAPQIMQLDHGGRIRYVWNGRHRERSFSRNEGLQLARGKYIAYLDDDDLFYPDHLATLVEVLEQTGCKVAYTDAYRAYQEPTGDGTYVTRKRDLPYSNDFDRNLILINNLLPICCLMHERSCLDSTGLFDETLATHEDWDLLIRLSRSHAPVHIKRVTAEFSWRMDGSTSTSSQQPDFKRTRAVIFERYAHEARGNPKILQLQRSILEQDGPSRPASSFDCSIIIPVWNKAELTRQCLTALGPATEDVSFELIVVDNGSTDGTKEFLASLGGDVRIITNQDNLGFAKACNQGAAAARGRHLVFLNNDTIPVAGWLRALVDEIDAHPEVAIVGSKLLYADRTVQHAGVAIDRTTLIPYHIYKRFADTHPAVNKRRELNAVTAACLLIRRNSFTDAGGFDEAYINGFEDADLCLKVRERQGRIVYQPKSVLFHLESQTDGRDSHTNENGRRFLQRWGQSWWLADDDTIYFGDGYKAVSREEGGRQKTDLHLIDSEQERQAWELVSSMQQAAHCQDLAAVEAVLNRHAEWPADSSVLQWAASVATAMKLPRVAEEFRRRIECLKDPAFRELEQIRAALTGGELSTASNLVDALIKQYPTHPEALLLRAILHMQREQYREAEIAFTTALNQGANRKKSLMGIGMASMGRAYPQSAWQTFLRVLAENPDDVEVIHWLLRAGTAQNRWRELSVQLRNFLARNPSDLSVRFAYSGVLLRADQVEAARQEYDQLRALAPSYDGLAELGQAIAGKETLLAMDVSHA